MQTTSAGKGDPYWYEWAVGLKQIVEMLDEKSGIASVSLQVAGIKGWDDVVVKYADGALRLIQVKHTRVMDTLTFGDLVGDGLIGELAEAWTQTDAPRGSSCILFTNRAAGERASKAESGTLRPALEKFWAWLKAEVAAGKSLDQCVPVPEWNDAWQEWRKAFGKVAVDKQTEFIRALTIESDQADLEETIAVIRSRLAVLFGISEPKAQHLLPALHEALRTWSTTKESVNLEDLLQALSLDEPDEAERHSPPPPSPFFESRKVALADIEKLLQVEAPAVVFLSAPPGAGKTSLISELANRRSPAALGGIIGLRYYAFRPITPDTPLVPPDSDQRVRADRLWFDLLSQLRRGLQGRLADFAVPVRNEFLNWEQARGHVLRIADRIGREIGRPFVIAIDGIDHAARAQRYEPAAAREFFQSLPSPEGLRGLRVKLLVAGQPAEHFPEYPGWLAANSTEVERMTVGRLEVSDIAMLLAREAPAMAPDAGARVIEEATQGNTLSVVFAVQEAKRFADVAELKQRLAEQKLGAQLDDYYRGVWQHALHNADRDGNTLEGMLAGALCVMQERITGGLLAELFPGLGKSAVQWELILARLGPLVIAETGGFRVMHNDVRIFLHGLLGAKTPAERQLVASSMADHYLKPNCNRVVAHALLGRLLKEAGREEEWARVFNMRFVLEAAALDVEFRVVDENAVTAIRAVIAARDWKLAGELACALECLGRWEDKLETRDARRDGYQPTIAPLFLLSESRVQPRDNWTREILSQVLSDTVRLLRANELNRATGLAQRWFGGLTLEEVAAAVATEDRTLDGRDHGPGYELGLVCAETGLRLAEGGDDSETAQAFIADFEQGWIAGCAVESKATTLEEFLRGRELVFIGGWQAAASSLAEAGAEGALRETLEGMANCYDKLSTDFKIEAAGWVVRMGWEGSVWTRLLDDTGLLDGTYETAIVFGLKLARTTGWLDATSEFGTIVDKLLVQMPSLSAGRGEPHARGLLLASACIGRIEGLMQRRGVDVARDIVPATEIQRIATTLWSDAIWREFEFRHRVPSGHLCEQFVAAVWPLGGDHRAALVRAATPAINAHVVDQRFASLWDLVRREGSRTQLRAWLEYWIGPQGAVWSGPNDDAESIYYTLKPLGVELGEAALLEEAKSRIAWMLITYRGHKDYAFVTPSNWFEQLVVRSPEDWRGLGTELWSLSDAASEAGCDNRMSWDFNSLLGAGAFNSGPDDVRRLIHAEQPYFRDSSWMHVTYHRLVGGAEMWLKTGDRTMADKLAVWSLLVGYSRWFNHTDGKAFQRLRAVFLETAGKGETEFRAEIRRLTPAEADRTVPEESDGRSASDAKPEPQVDELRKKFRDGAELMPKEAARFVATLRQGSGDEPVVEVLRSIGTGSDWGGTWKWYDWATRKSLVDMAACSNDAEMWAMMESATRHTKGTRWPESVAENMQQVLLARADALGVDELRTGLERILGMHELWLRGGQKWLPFEAVKLPGTGRPLTWGELAAGELRYLLESRSAEVLHGALHGIQVLVSHQPQAIGWLLNDLPSDPWVRKWLLLAAEVWAWKFPEEFGRAAGNVRPVLEAGEFPLRVQGWVVLALHAKATGQVLPTFPQRKEEPEEKAQLVQPEKQLLETPERQIGGMRFAGPEHAVIGVLNRIAATTGAELEEVLSNVAIELSGLPVRSRGTREGPKHLHHDGGMYCGSTDAETALGHALDRFMAENPLPEHLAGSFAQAYLPGDDPWILRQTPVPDPEPDKWPAEAKLGHDEETAPTSGQMKREMLDFALSHAVGEHEQVLGAHYELSSSHEDMSLWLWWEEGDPGSLRPGKLPTTVSARVFPLLLDRWWEPGIKRGKRPFVFRTGPLLRLRHAIVELYPAWFWRAELKWNPRPSDPLVWEKNGKVVARFERRHGPLRWIHGNGLQRQPLLSRWLVTKEAWGEAKGILGPVRLNDQFERHDWRMG